MEFALTDDQDFFRETTQKYLSSECPIVKVRALRSSPRGFEPEYWRQGAELGWMSLVVPEEHGGGSVSGRGVSDLTLVADAFGTHVAPGPLLPCNVVAATLARSGSADQQRDLLPGLVSGELVATWAYSEAPPNDALGAVALRAAVDGDDFVLRGVKSPVEAGAESQYLLVTARSDAGPTQFLVPTESPGLDVTVLRSVDMVRRYARVAFDDVRVPSSAVVGEVGDAASDIEQQLRLAGVVQTAEMVGAARKVLEITLDWAFSRYSFGRPLASYQEIKHRCADMKMWLEASEALSDEAARKVQDDDVVAGQAVSAATAYAGQYLAELVQDCVQMHGGIGVTYEHDLHLYLRRVTVDRMTYGTPADHLGRLAALRADAA